MEVNFYAIYFGELHKSLISLLDKTLKINKTALVVAEEDDYNYNNKKLDELLWTSTAWLPHCLYEEQDTMQTPVIIFNPNNYIAEKISFVFLLNKVSISNFNNIEKLFIIFDANDSDSLSYNRKRWKEFKELNFNMKFYKQLKDGKFEEKQL